MLTTKGQNNTLYGKVAAVLAVAATVFSVLASSATEMKWLDSVLFYCSSETETVFAGFLFPACMLFVTLFARSAREKYSMILFFKVIAELCLLPFGININMPAAAFSGDLSLLFFILTDLILLAVVQNYDINKKSVRGASAVALFACVNIAVYSLALDWNRITALRAVYLICVYALLWCLSYCIEDLDTSRCGPELEHDKVVEELKTWSYCNASFTMLCIVGTAVLIASVSYFYFLACEGGISSRESFRWFKLAVSLLRGLMAGLGGVAVAEFGLYTRVKGAVISLVSALAGTLAAMVTVYYGNYLYLDSFAVNGLHTSLGRFIFSELTLDSRTPWIHFGLLFAAVFIATMIAVEKRNNIPLDEDFDEEYECEGHPSAIRDALDKLRELFFTEESFNDYENDEEDEADDDTVDGEESEKADDEAEKESDNGDESVKIYSRGRYITIEARKSTKALGAEKFFVINGTEYIITNELMLDRDKIIIYTDNRRKEDGTTYMYASKYDPEAEEIYIMPLDNNLEWSVVREIIGRDVDRLAVRSECMTADAAEAAADTVTE